MLDGSQDRNPEFRPSLALGLRKQTVFEGKTVQNQCQNPCASAYQGRLAHREAWKPKKTEGIWRKPMRHASRDMKRRIRLRTARWMAPNVEIRSSGLPWCRVGENRRVLSENSSKALQKSCYRPTRAEIMLPADAGRAAGPGVGLAKTDGF